MKWYLMAWKKYFQFSGRSRRKEFWMFTLFTFIASMLVRLLDDMLGTNYGASTPIYTGDELYDSLNVYASQGTGILGTIYSIAVFIPTLALSVRRLHDVNRTGLWYLGFLIPVILFVCGLFFSIVHWPGGFLLLMLGTLGTIGLGLALFIWACTDGTTGPNQYGADPKGNNDMSEYGGVFEQKEN